MQILRYWHAFLLLAFTCSLPAAANAADSARGRQLAAHWCAECHVTSKEQKSGNTQAPTFAAIASKFADDEKLSNFLAHSYPRMPNMNLSRTEIADLVAYIRTTADAH